MAERCGRWRFPTRRQEIQHPLFGYRCTYRRIFELEARLLARYLLGEIAELPGFRVR